MNDILNRRQLQAPQIARLRADDHQAFDLLLELLGGEELNERKAVNALHGLVILRWSHGVTAEQLGRFGRLLIQVGEADRPAVREYATAIAASLVGQDELLRTPMFDRGVIELLAAFVKRGSA